MIERQAGPFVLGIYADDAYLITQKVFTINGVLAQVSGTPIDVQAAGGVQQTLLAKFVIELSRPLAL